MVSIERLYWMMYSKHAAFWTFTFEWRVSCGQHHSHWRQTIQTRPFVPVSIVGSMCFFDLGSTGVVASQTRLDAPRGWLCRRPCHAQFLLSKHSFETKQKHFSIVQLYILWLVRLSRFIIAFGCWAFPKTRDRNRPGTQTDRMKCATNSKLVRQSCKIWTKM